MLRIDSHHHFWQYNAAEFGWLEGDLTPLRRDYLPADLRHELEQAGVGGTVAVQARQTIAETDWLLALAADDPLILGVVGWLPLREADFPRLLDRYAGEERLKGLRHVVQAEAAGFMEDARFNAGMCAMRDHDLVYDLLIFERQLEEATRLVDRHPNQRFVLDHLAKPRIRTGDVERWASALRELALRENVLCKVSGMVTEADPTHWSAGQLRPYFDVVLECFTPARLMAGSDWPVLGAGCSYERWWELLSEWSSTLSLDEQSDFMGGTAAATYDLALPPADHPRSTGAQA